MNETVLKNFLLCTRQFLGTRTISQSHLIKLAQNACITQSLRFFVRPCCNIERYFRL